MLHICSKWVVFETEALYLCVLLFKMISIIFFLHFSFGHLLTVTICNKSFFLIINKKEYFSGTREKCTILFSYPEVKHCTGHYSRYRSQRSGLHVSCCLLEGRNPPFPMFRELIWSMELVLLVAACTHSLFPHSDTPLWPSLSSKRAFDSSQMKIKFSKSPKWLRNSSLSFKISF